MLDSRCFTPINGNTSIDLFGEAYLSDAPKEIFGELL